MAHEVVWTPRLHPDDASQFNNDEGLIGRAFQERLSMPNRKTTVARWTDRLIETLQSDELMVSSPLRLCPMQN